MVIQISPIFIIAAALGFAFLYPLFEKIGKRFAAALGLILLAGFTGISLSWFIAQLNGSAPVIAQTAGFSAPMSINLMVGQIEALVLGVMSLVALLALWFQSFATEQPWKGRQVVLFFVMILGTSGLVMTRDVFNIFVFMEIASISLYGLLSTSKDTRSYEAGFKYMIAGGLASTFYLIGVAFLYRMTGTLNIDSMLGSAAGNITGVTGLLAMLLFLTGILIELKPAFANGWALDSYEAADPGVGALLSAILTTAMVMVIYKIMPLVFAAAPVLMNVISILGGLGFVVSSLMALNQKSLGRMLGLSSIAQTGLVLLVLTLPSQVAGLSIWLLLTHAMAKPALFWLSDILKAKYTYSPESLRSRKYLLIVAGLAVFALIGLPPFPSFWAKWFILSALIASANWLPVVVLILGTLLEAAYLFKWFLSIVRAEGDSGDIASEYVPDDFEPADKAMESRAASVSQPTAPGWTGIIPGIIVAVLFCIGMFVSILSFSDLESIGSLFPLLPIVSILLFGLFDLIRIPQKIQVILAMAGLALLAYLTVPVTSGLVRIFGLLFLAGTFIQLLAFLTRKGRGDGTLALVVGLSTALATLVLAHTALDLFFAWEMMTITSFLLVLKGRKSSAAAFRFIMFSLVSAYSLLCGLLILQGQGVLQGGLLAFGAEGTIQILPAVLIALAAVIKLGSLGFHLWLPSAYAEAEDDVSSLLSSVLSKAGVFLLFLTGGVLTAQLVPSLSDGVLAGIPVNSLLGWLGAITAVAGALMALFQEDIKYTLAYSSMGQVGYMLLAFSMMTHLGHVTSLYLAITHLLFKGMLWLAVLGVIQQTGTRLMYKMGGLIKTMPWSFLSVLFAIIAVSGVPPLSGFGGKWLLYTALLEKGWYLQAGLAMFSSGIAFLYLYRLIHSIFLGQPKDELAMTREAPAIQIIPQYIFMGGIMAISMFPNLLLKPLQAAVEPLFASTIEWNGYEVISSLGYWNGNAVMYVTMGVFALPLIILLIANSTKKLQSVKQFNIVYSAERPYKPQTTHYAFNFFAHYEKALGFLVKPWATKFWTGVSSVVYTIGDTLRRWNTGNPQTYGFQILLYLILVFVLATSQGGV